MNPHWKQYQEHCATFFRDIGLKAEVEKTVGGVRGSHTIDVFVTGALSGIQLTWIVECKAWKTNIPKEKVLTLIAIVQDMGADKGILLSEVGFQSGAIRSVKGTNVLLTSLQDLKEQVRETLVESAVARLNLRLTLVIHDLRILNNVGPPASSPEEGKLILLERAFREALQGNFPVFYAVKKDKVVYAHSFEELVAVSDKLLRGAEAYISKEEKSGRGSFLGFEK